MSVLTLFAIFIPLLRYYSAISSSIFLLFYVVENTHTLPDSGNNVMQLTHRPRRIRKQKFSRNLVCETRLSIDDFIYPVFVIPGENREQVISSMPGIKRYSLDLLVTHLKPLVRAGLNAVALFPVIGKELKSTSASEAWNPKGLVQQAIAKLKSEFPQLGVISDVALDPYTSHGQDGIIDEQGYVINDVTVEALVKQALSQAEAGADVVAPSDMMDGRIGAIRDALEVSGHVNTCILSYSAKYASSLYNPFRDAVGSAQALGKADKKNYQMDPANIREALHEVSLDLEQGSDMVLIKPAMFYLDVITQVKESFTAPVFAYQVSGEYCMLMASIEQGWLDDSVIYESLLSIKRSGADAILSYFSARLIEEGLV